ncbi:hypothetical protein SBA6_320006 [Candidatus Sulfopaludibacter sp. SbA6]|nr:hypothetical protein SBA6_320006 [Candidatus Sulfopaludibacter sp. SbA6]
MDSSGAKAFRLDMDQSHEFYFLYFRDLAVALDHSELHGS